MSKQSYSDVIHVTVGGRPLRSAQARQLVGAWVDLAAGVPAAFQLTFRDQHRRMLAETGTRIGTRVVLAPVADGKGAQEPLLTGEVTALETEYDATGTFTVVRGYDRGHRMLRTTRVVGYRRMTASAIVSKVARQDGIPLGRIEPTTTRYDFISQDNVTDWDFLTRLAADSQRVLFLDPQGKLQFVQPERAARAPSESTSSDASPYVLRAGTDILRCRASVTSADQTPRVGARGWDVQTKRALTHTAPATKNNGIDIGLTPSAAHRFGSGELVDTSVPYDKLGQVKQAADALADDVTSAFAEVEVLVHGNPKLRPDESVALTEVGEPFEGKYTMTSVRHVFGDSEPYQTMVRVSGRQWRSLYGLASGGGGGGASSTAPQLPGVANAVVTDTKDPKRQGRVKLKFPWLDDSYVSDWARTVQFGGVGGGSIFPLDVNDEVLVAFDRGALDHPYVIGGLFNGRDTPQRGDVPLNGLRGKASRHTLADRENNRVDLLSQKAGLRKNGVRLSTGNNRLTINLDRTNTEITVDSAGSVTIKGNRSVSIDAGANLNLQAKGTLTMRSGGALNIQSGGALSVRSGGVLGMNAGGAFNLSGAAAGNIGVAGALKVSAGAEANYSAGAATQLVAGGNMAVTSANIALLGFVTANGTPVI